MNTTIWQRLQNIDRRVIYVLLIASIVIPLFIPGSPVPIIASQQSKDFYNTIEGLAKSDPEHKKLVIVDGWWAAGTRGENKWQTQAILTHLMQRGIHFAFVSFDPQNNTLTQNLVDTLAPQFHYVYGQDYVNWGYRTASVFPQTLKGLASPNGLQGAVKVDAHGTPIGQFPVMQNVKDLKDVGAIIEISPVGSLPTWVGLVQGKYNTPLLYAPTAVMAPDAYPFLDSGQVSGLLTGIKGAGDYEQLTHTQTFGTRATGALSLVYALIILLVILGNVGYYAGRTAAKREGR